MANLTDRELKQLLEGLGQVASKVGGSEGRNLSRLIRAIGGMPALLDYLAQTSQRPSRRRGESLQDLVEQDEQLRDELQRIGRRPPRVVKPVRIGGRSTDSAKDTAIEPQVLPTLAAPHIDTGRDPLNQMFETPASSNVYGFTYDKHNQILYVQFKAPGPIVKWEWRTNSCTGERYKMGHRAHNPGPIYAYGSRARPIPENVWDEMLLAASKGEFIWEKFRVCGSNHAHKAPYVLVSPSMAGGNMYVPRKATGKGYRVRTVPTVGFGKRPFDRSNLPGYNEDRQPRSVRRIGGR